MPEAKAKAETQVAAIARLTAELATEKANRLEDIADNGKLDDELAEAQRQVTALRLRGRMWLRWYGDGLSEKQRTELEKILKADEPVTTEQATDAMVERVNRDQVFRDGEKPT